MNAPAWHATSGARLSVRSGALALRQFAPDDTRALYDIRNHPTVRGFMPDPAPLAYAAHSAWVAAHLVKGSAYLVFLIRVADEPVGFALLKRLDARGEQAEIGLMLRDAAVHGGVAGRAAVIMAWLAANQYGVTEIVTYAHPAHARALALNRQIGLVDAPSDKAGEYCFRAPTSTVLNNPRVRRIMARIGPHLQMSTPG